MRSNRLSMATNPEPASARAIIIKTVVTHTVTYFFVGALAFTVFNYPRLYAESSFKYIMRQTTEPLVMAGPLFQPLRGLIFGVVFFVLRQFLLWTGQGLAADVRCSGVSRYLGNFRANTCIAGRDNLYDPPAPTALDSAAGSASSGSSSFVHRVPLGQPSDEELAALGHGLAFLSCAALSDTRPGPG